MSGEASEPDEIGKLLILRDGLRDIRPVRPEDRA